MKSVSGIAFTSLFLTISIVYLLQSYNSSLIDLLVIVCSGLITIPLNILLRIDNNHNLERISYEI
jgi:uncharacterized membrane protein YpjA